MFRDSCNIIGCVDYAGIADKLQVAAAIELDGATAENNQFDSPTKLGQTRVIIREQLKNNMKA